jgi:general secretion pathway protein F
MTAFRYRAVDANGRELDGILEADTQRQIRSQLRERGLFPVDVAPVSERGNTRVRRQRLSNADLTLLTRQWATLIAAGLTIEQTLSAAIDQSESASTRQLIAGIRNEITAGHSLSEALNRYPTVFPPIYRALIRSGEKSGELEQILLRLADYLENRHALRQKILQALLYPALVTLVALGVIGGMMAFVVPQVVGVFRHSKQALPFLTQALVWISDFLRIAGPWLLLAGVLGLIGGLRLLRHEATRRRFHRSVLQVPILGRLLRTLDSARFAQTLSILVGGGVPLLNALEAGRDVMLLLPLRDSVDNAIGRVREGSGLARALSQDKQLPPLLLHLIASGEASGELGPMLERAAKQQQDEVSNRTALLVGILEPLLILAMGGIVLLIVLAVLQPIIEINQLVR